MHKIGISSMASSTVQIKVKVNVYTNLLLFAATEKINTTRIDDKKP